MKKFVAPKDPQELAAAFPLHDLVPGWYFRVREISSGQFVADGADLYGRTVSNQGDDPQNVLCNCVNTASGSVSQASDAGSAA
jgi:hypothetical protein